MEAHLSDVFAIIYEHNLGSPNGIRLRTVVEVCKNVSCTDAKKPSGLRQNQRAKGGARIPLSLRFSRATCRS